MKLSDDCWKSLFGVVFLLGLSNSLAGQAVESNVTEPTTENDLLSIAERTGYRATATSAEVVALVDRIAQRAGHISRFDFGKTFEGRTMVGAIVANPHVTSPEELQGDDRLVVLINANIHSGECCGKEAMLRMLRELSARPDHPWLDKLVLLITPNYNADGNDRMAKDNRPGQIGPVDGMGQRPNAQGYDLNREYVKLESPECRALVGLFNRWDAHCVMDLHTTNGSWHRYHLTYDVQHNPAADEGLSTLMREKMMPEVTRKLAARGVDTFYYGNFEENNTRWVTTDHKPRFGLDSFALRGRMSILSEAYSYITFQERIEATHALVEECMTYLAANAREVGKTLQDARRRTVEAGKNPQAGDMVPIRAQIAPFAEKFLVKGYDPPRRPKVDTTGRSPGVRAEPPGVPKDYQVDFYGRFEPTGSVQRPLAYLIPADQSRVVERLGLHGFQLERLTEETSLYVEVYRWKILRTAEREFQKHRLATAEVTVRRETRTVAKGTYVVRTAQPMGTLLIYVLEPESDDGFVTWNFFDDQYAPGTDYPILRIPAATTLPTERVVNEEFPTR